MDQKVRTAAPWLGIAFRLHTLDRPCLHRFVEEQVHGSCLPLERAKSAVCVSLLVSLQQAAFGHIRV